MAEIDKMQVMNGRHRKEDDSVVNIADILERLDLPTSIEDLSGSTNATPNTVNTLTFAATSKSLYFKNKDGAESILVSFDGGTSWVTFIAGADFDSGPVALANIKVKSSVASVPFMLLVKE